MRLLFTTFLLLFICFDLSAQRDYKLNSDREFPDLIFHASFGYVYDAQGLQNKVQLEYFSKSQFSLGLSLNYLNERFKDGPASFVLCGPHLGNSRSIQEMYYISGPFSFHFGIGKLRDVITFSTGPAFGIHNYPKEFIDSSSSGFLFSSPCKKVIYTRDVFVALDTQLDFNFRFGARSGFFVGANILTIPMKSPRIIFHFGYLVDIF